MMSTSSGYSSPKLCDRTSLLTPSSCHKMMVWWGGERAYIRNLILLCQHPGTSVRTRMGCWKK